ncbi:MAG: membrane protein insertase YidC, partial [Nocardioides sp.]
MGFFTDIGGFIMTPLYYAISAIMLGWHELFSLFLDPEGGLSWVLSIIGLTLVIRMALIPLFVKQIKSSRNMQLIQPKVKELQKKYGHDRQKLAEETMKLYKDAGTNPFASCLPILLQMPIFFALFRLLDQAAKKSSGRGFLTDARAEDFGQSKIFGQIPISETFWESGPWSASSPDVGVMIVAAILVLAMTATTFTTQRQLMSKNMPADALTGPYAQQQKILLYVLPVAFGLGGVAFPIGVLLYWTTSNLWTMGQQFYVIRNNPAPGTPAFQAKADRDQAKALKKGGGVAELTETTPEPELDRRPAVREQPKRQTKSQRKQAAPPAKPGANPSPQKKPGPNGQKPASQKPAGQKQTGQ